MTPWERDNAIYSHEKLWDAAQSALAMAAIDDERIRPDHLAIHSLLTGFIAFEGFVNVVGEEIAQEEWADERKFFARSPYRGILGKVDYLFTKKFSEAVLNKYGEPYATHSRVYRYKEVSSSEYPLLKTLWEDFDTPEKVKLSLNRLQEFAEIIRIEAVKLLEDDQPSHLRYPTFSGPFGHSEGKRESRSHSN
jgi:hypothetical protein